MINATALANVTGNVSGAVGIKELVENSSSAAAASSASAGSSGFLSGTLYVLSLISKLVSMILKYVISLLGINPPGWFVAVLTLFIGLVLVFIGIKIIHFLTKVTLIVIGSVIVIGAVILMFF